MEVRNVTIPQSGQSRHVSGCHMGTSKEVPPTLPAREVSAETWKQAGIPTLHSKDPTHLYFYPQPEGRSGTSLHLLE